MSGSWIALLELALVLFAVLAFGIWQLRSLEKDKDEKKSDKRKK